MLGYMPRVMLFNTTTRVSWHSRCDRWREATHMVYNDVKKGEHIFPPLIALSSIDSVSLIFREVRLLFWDDRNGGGHIRIDIGIRCSR